MASMTHMRLAMYKRKAPLVTALLFLLILSPLIVTVVVAIAIVVTSSSSSSPSLLPPQSSPSSFEQSPPKVPGWHGGGPCAKQLEDNAWPHEPTTSYEPDELMTYAPGELMRPVSPVRPMQAMSRKSHIGHMI